MRTRDPLRGECEHPYAQGFRFRALKSQQTSLLNTLRSLPEAQRTDGAASGASHALVVSAWRLFGQRTVGAAIRD